MKIELTDTEWMSLLDMTRDGLPYCCANVSALRDELLALVSGGCELNDWSMPRFLRTYDWAVNGHDFEKATLQKVLDQVLSNEENAKYWAKLEAAKEHEREQELRF